MNNGTLDKDSFEQSDLTILNENVDDISYEELDKEIERQIKSNIKELDQLKINKEKIGDPKKLADSISKIVWEQFILQVAGTAGADFIKSNHDLNLSLKKADHYLESNKFVKNELPTHNFSNQEAYANKYNEWCSNFKDGNPNNGIRRDAFPYVRGNGSMSMDHTVPLKEIITDPDMAAFVSQEDKKKFACDPTTNLKPMDREANSSKGAKTMTEWLDSERDGKKPAERFNIDEDECRKNDKIAREAKQKLVDEGKEQAAKEDHASRIDEFNRSAQYTLQAVAIALMAKLTKTIFEEVIRWLSEKEHKSKDLIEHIKKAIHDFVFDFKNNVLMSLDVGVTVIFTQLFGAIIPMIKKALMFLTIGGKTVIDVAKYLKKPENAEKDTSTKVLEVGQM